MLTKTLSVSAIKNGTVIDHITVGRAFRIVDLLQLSSCLQPVTIGLHLPSPSMKYKDIIKVEDRALTVDEANQVAIFAPQATISIIKDYEIANKFKVCIPKILQSTPLRCPNPTCITNHEPMGTCFHIQSHTNSILLQCQYCERRFSEQEMKK